MGKVGVVRGVASGPGIICQKVGNSDLHTIILLQRINCIAVACFSSLSHEAVMY